MPAETTDLRRYQAAEAIQGPKSPRLSVTVLNYNYAHYLPDCLDSILGQTFGDFELIIIDDCSSDDSMRVIAPYRSDGRVRLVRHPVNRGFVSSLIEGTEQLSRGELLTVISADDLVRRPDAFERQLAAFDARDDVVMSFCSYERFDSVTGETIAIQRSYDDDTLLDGLSFFRGYLTELRVQVLHSGAMFRREGYSAAGGYRRDMRYAVDFALWPLLALEGKVAYCSDTLYKYRDHGSQMSHSFRGVRATMVEVVSAVETACRRAEQRGMDGRSVRGVATRSGLFADALDDAFGERAGLALARCATAITIRPWEALAGRGLWITLARVLLGKRGFRLLRGAVLPGGGASPPSAEALRRSHAASP